MRQGLFSLRYTATRVASILSILALSAPVGAQDPAGAGAPSPAPAPAPPPADTPPAEPTQPAAPASATPGPSAPASPPAAVPPAAVPPAAAPAAAPPASPGASAVATPPSAPTKARVELRVNYPDAWLELRSVTYGGPWQRACLAPCGNTLEVDGTEARVRAPGMTTTSVFRLQPGVGTARLRVDGGSSDWRDRGVWLLALGTPVALAGGVMFGFGTYDDKSGLRTAGLATMITAGVAVIASLPMLMSGSTSVRNFDGKVIAKRSAPGLWSF